MEAAAVPLNRILSSNTQMVIPIFQREYHWQYEQVKTLWDDIIKLYDNIQEKNNKNLRHFLGPIVRAHITKSSVDTQKHHLIDGQQRIATLMILLAAMRNKFKATNEPLVKKIENNYLLNQGEEDENILKLLPSEGDRTNFSNIIKGEGIPSKSKLKDTFDFFTKKIEEETQRILENLRDIIVNNLILVNIDVGEHENPYLIFESLNATGTPLTQADLIRNYIFMKIPDETRQKELYHSHWRPMEIALGDKLADFFWQYSKIDGSFVKRERTYSNMKGELEFKDTNSVEQKIALIHEYSKFYLNFIKPENEPDPKIALRLKRHLRWEITTEYPFLLNVYKDYADKKIHSEDLCNILDIIESFVVRRFFANLPTNKLNQLFIQIYRKLDKANVVVSFQHALQKDWPNNEDFIKGLQTNKIYPRHTDRTKMILESLEDHFQHKEPLNYTKLQVEHILPQESDNPEKLIPAWKEVLGPKYADIHRKYVHTIANLTLTGYNPESSNKSFEEKKQVYTESHLELNKYFNLILKWNEDEILKRSILLTKVAIEVWKYPNFLASIKKISSPLQEKIGFKLGLSFNNAFYINLGEGKKWAESSIKEGKIRFGWKEVPLKEIHDNNSEIIKKYIRPTIKNEGAVTRDFNALMNVVQSHSGDLWLSVYNNNLWWCFIKDGKVEEDEISKYREVDGVWSNKAKSGMTLIITEIPEDLRKTLKFSATLCRIEYLKLLQDLIFDDKSS